MRSSLLLLYSALFLAISCTTLPQADFYEVKGLVSIKAESLPNQNNWQAGKYSTSVSMISVEGDGSTAGTLTFPFYVRQPGSYSVWVLSKKFSENDQENVLPLRVMDEEGFLVDQYLLELNRSDELEWLNRDQRSGDRIFADFHQPGHYQIQFESAGNAGFVVDKIHLSLNDERAPTGFGYPETSNPAADPVLARRDQFVTIPPAWLFEPVCIDPVADAEKIYLAEYRDTGSVPGCRQINLTVYEDIEHQNTMNLTAVERAFLSSQEYQQIQNARGLILAPAVHLHRPEFKIYPTRWDANIKPGFREQIEMIANPRRTTYEVPFLVNRYHNLLFEKSEGFSEELFLRWMQFAAFNTVMHVPQSEEFRPERDLTDEGFAQFEELIQLRRELFPFIYSLAHLVRPTGEKPVRGNALHGTQFMLGEALLIAPIYEESVEGRVINFPEGTWYNYWDGTRYEGGQSWFVEIPLRHAPVFVKAGSIIPYRDYDSTEKTGRLNIHVYGGGIGTFRLYEDDEVSTSYRSGDFSTTAFRYFEHEDYATFTIGRMVRGYEGQPDQKELNLMFRYLDEPVSVTVEGVDLEMGSGSNEWFYDSESQTLSLNWLNPNDQKADFRIEF